MNTVSGGVGVKKGQGHTARGTTGRTPHRTTVYKLPDGTPVTAASVTARRRKYTPRARACKVCGTEFRPLAKGAKFCSSACKAKAYRQRQARAKADQPREVVVEALTCACCGGGFLAVNKSAKYCSDRCRARTHKARRQAAIIALEVEMGISHDKAADLVEALTMRQATEFLQRHGYTYDENQRAWLPPLQRGHVFVPTGGLRLPSDTAVDGAVEQG